MRKIAFAVSTTLMASFGYADTSIDKFMGESSTQLNLRYRFEAVDQEGFNSESAANSLRTRLSFNSGVVSGFQLGLEFDDVRHIGDDRFNSTSNGKTAYPVVADPDGTDLNQLFVKFKAENLTATAGRQRINLDDQRFIGGVAWRQNEQTYDGLRMQYEHGDLSADYSYVAQVNRIFGPTGDRATLDGDLHLLNANWNITAEHAITGFYYDMDFEDSASLSNTTLGLRYLAKFKPLTLTASVASQSETGAASINYTALYYLIEAKGNLAMVKWSAGYEVLGSDDGMKAFQTPLATAHKFQGFADKFLSTPATGIEDMYIGLGTALGPVNLSLTYHDFNAAEGSNHHGSEWDLAASYPITKNLNALLKFADYQADDHGTDTQKLWLQLQLSL